jgi:hypothetical protein
VLRGILNTVPTAWLLVAAVAVSLAAVLLSVVVIRRIVPSTREGYHAEISAPMLGVVAALFGLLLAFVIVIAYQNYLAAQANLSREADSLSSTAPWPGADWTASSRRSRPSSRQHPHKCRSTTTRWRS